MKPANLNPRTTRAVNVKASRSTRRDLFAFWLDHRGLDWACGALIGYAVRVGLLGAVHLGKISPAIRFSVYAAVAAGMFAFVAIAFTPLAILSALGPGSNVDRLRRFSSDIRRSFLRGTLVLLLCGLVMIGAGAADATRGGSSLARWVAAGAVGLGMMKVLRLTGLFSAILGASDRDQERPARNRHLEPA